ncbi:MAG: type II secretion system protein [Elusimicrobia bacterium]|nr:type II secretion system protein [Elusimicrobiota bacterium]
MGRSSKALRDRRGFGTNIELQLIVAIIGILAAVAIPKFAELIRQSNEGASKGNIGALRSALAIHYGDHEGWYPFFPGTLAGGGLYLSSIPRAKTPNYHPDSADIRLGHSILDADDRGGWLYVSDVKSADWGAIVVNCTHTDTKGTLWLAY